MCVEPTIFLFTYHILFKIYLDQFNPSQQNTKVCRFKKQWREEKQNKEQNDIHAFYHILFEIYLDQFNPSQQNTKVWATILFYISHNFYSSVDLYYLMPNTTPWGLDGPTDSS